jgi:hypothetical protein
MDVGLIVWLQGGPANDWRYETLIEPPDVIKVIPDPFHEGVWIRVVGPWPDAVHYQRQPAVEQFDHERIYYPVAR